MYDDLAEEIPGSRYQLFHHDADAGGPAHSQVMVRFPNGYGASVIHYDPPYDRGVTAQVVRYFDETWSLIAYQHGTKIGRGPFTHLSPDQLLALLKEINDL